MAERSNSFADLNNIIEPPAFQTKPKGSNMPDKGNVDQISVDQGFPSRKAQPATPARRQRRYTTGRNQQINFKAKAETIARFNRLADERNLSLCETLEVALDGLEQSTNRKS
jgi:hypothetical protein